VLPMGGWAYIGQAASTWTQPERSVCASSLDDRTPGPPRMQPWPSDKLSKLRKSRRTGSSQDRSDHPLTCLRPVIPGRDEPPLDLNRSVLVALLRQRGPRTNELHLAAKDVDQLRQLVEGQPPQEMSDVGGLRCCAP
jgi:hypothetical protein